MPKRVLLVDDIPGYLDILELYMPAGVEVCRGASLDDARELLSEQRFDLAIVDVRLSETDPGNRDGLKLLGWCCERLEELPVVMISGYREFEYEVESLASGARAFLHKPLDPRRLRDLLSTVFEEEGAKIGRPP